MLRGSQGAEGAPQLASAGPGHYYYDYVAKQKHSKKAKDKEDSKIVQVVIELSYYYIYYYTIIYYVSTLA